MSFFTFCLGERQQGAMEMASEEKHLKNLISSAYELCGL
jgi:hypothetical protein